MAIILANCVFLALNDEITFAEYIFTGLYTFEVLIKILARGLLLHPFSYLRDPWNWLDFIVVILAYSTITVDANVSSLRTFRVFRAFKSVSIVPGLKTIVNALFHSMKPLAEVMLIMLFLVIVVALIGLQAFQGVLRHRCVKTPDPDLINSDQAWASYVTNTSNWDDVDGEKAICGNNTGSGKCPIGYLCIPDIGENPNYGYTNFDQMGYSLLTSFQLITLDYWENVFNMIIRAEGPFTVMFFMMSVFLGPFYLLNLLLAVVTLAYSREHEKQEELEQMRRKAKERTKRKNQRKRKLEEYRQKELNSLSVPVFSSVVSNLNSNQPRSSWNLSEGHSLAEDSIRELKDDFQLVSETNDRMSSKRNSFKFKNHFESIESNDSAKSELAQWQQLWNRFSDGFVNLFCQWNCHPKFLKLQDKLILVIRHKFFETFIIGCIIINTIFLSINYYGMSANLDAALELGNKIFSLIFIVEAIFKLVAMGPVTYARDPWNDFDFVIVFISVVELLIGLSAGGAGGTGLNVLRTLRLLRVFRLARMWKTMNKLVTIIWKSVGAVSYLTLVLFLILYIFAVIGKQLYSKQYDKNCRNCTSDGNCSRNEQIPRWNFNDFYHSFLLVWRVMCGEWIELLYECLNVTCGDAFCAPLFLTIMFVANFMILNLFTAILLEAFNVDSLKGKENSNKNSNAIKQGLDAFEKTINKEKNENKKEDSNNLDNKLQSRLSPIPGSYNSELNQTRSPRDNNQEHVTHFNQLKNKESILLKKQNTLVSLPFFGEEEIIDNSNDAKQNDVKTAPKMKISNGNSKYSVNKARRYLRICSQLCGCCRSNEVDPDFESPSTSSDQMKNNSKEPEDEKKQSPDCFPKWLQTSYPWLAKTPNSLLYRTWIKTRQRCFNLVEHKIFEWFILFLILSSTICLAMEDVYLDRSPIKKQVLHYLEYVFTILFTFEMILKWIGIGFTQYFTSVWCLLDCSIVGASWAGIILQATSSATQTSAFRSLRTLRALRPLRAISRWQGMRVVVNALIYCIPSIGNVICVCLLIWLVFGIMGVQFFQGKFFRCVDESNQIVTDPLIRTKSDCLSNSKLSWINPNINFDNVLNAMVALFQVATFEGWIEVMADASDAVGVDQQPIRDHSQYYLIFFVVFVLVGSFFILNLIVGVIIESFQKLRKQTESSSAVETLLTESQKKFYKTMRTMLNRKPKKSIPAPTNKFQLSVFNVVTNSRFEISVFSIIGLNMVALSMEHYQMSPTWTSTLKLADIVFTSLFTFEAVLKLIGMRFHYFRDMFNVFDFIVILVSITGFILESLATYLLVSPTLLRVVRVFRVFRVLRVVRAARGIRRLILTLVISIPALFNIAVLLSVFLVIFAILGMTSFMHVKLTGALNDVVNFQTFGNSMMVLFRLVTAAGWNDVLDPLMNTRNCTKTASDGTPGDCGDPTLAILYFVSLIFIVFLVVVNMYIAIILENFDEIFQQDESGVSQGDFETFYMVWGRYDPRATQFVTLTELSNFLHDLHPPFQLPKPNLIKIAALDLPVLYGDKVHCLDVLSALVKRIMGEVEMSEDMRKEAEERLLKSFPNRKTLKIQTTTLILRQQARAAKVIQDMWKDFTKRRHEAGVTDTEINSLVSSFFPHSSSEDLVSNEFFKNRNKKALQSLNSKPNTDEKVEKRFSLMKKVSEFGKKTSVSFVSLRSLSSDVNLKSIADIRSSSGHKLNTRRKESFSVFDSQPVVSCKLKRRNSAVFLTSTEKTLFKIINEKHEPRPSSFHDFNANESKKLKKAEAKNKTKLVKEFSWRSLIYPEVKTTFNEKSVKNTTEKEESSSVGFKMKTFSTLSENCEPETDIL